MYDIRQVTNFSSEVTSAPTENVEVYINDKEKAYVTYYVLDMEILTGSSNIPINKIGYICEPKAINYPIIITTGNKERVISIGKTGMYEAMPEVFLDINDEDAEKLDCIPEITEIKIPKGQLDEVINFKLDYIYSVN